MIISDRREVRQSWITILFIIVLFLADSFCTTNDIIPSGIIVFAWLVIFMHLIFRCHAKLIIEYILPALVSLGLMLLTSIITNDSIIRVLKVAFSFIVISLFVQVFNFDLFKLYFVKAMRVLCIISLFLFMMYILIPSLHTINVVRGSHGITVSNLYLYVDPVFYTRNCGMFWEPGAFQTFIIIAMLFLVYGEENRLFLFDLMVFSLTTITTFSTTGYIGLALVYYLLLVKRRKISNNVKAIILCAIVGFGVYIYYNYDLFFSLSSNTVFGKISNFIIKREYDNTVRLSSASVRYYAIIKPIEVFIRHPFLGVGYDGLSNETIDFTKGMNTCTFINWFATYGVLYGTLMTIGMFKICLRISSGKISHALVIMLIMFCITATENYILDPVLFAMIIYGYVYKDEYIRENINYSCIQQNSQL